MEGANGVDAAFEVYLGAWHGADICARIGEGTRFIDWTDSGIDCSDIWWWLEAAREMGLGSGSAVPSVESAEATVDELVHRTGVAGSETLWVNLSSRGVMFKGRIMRSEKGDGCWGWWSCCCCCCGNVAAVVVACSKLFAVLVNTEWPVVGDSKDSTDFVLDLSNLFDYKSINRIRRLSKFNIYIISKYVWHNNNKSNAIFSFKSKFCVQKKF